MPQQLPPLNSLRAFEAAARHLSFSKAAAELHVTPAAVSQHVKNLEDHFNVQLFQRLTRSLRITEAGRSVVPALQEGFDKLREVDHALRHRAPGRVFTASVAPTFAAKWLVPRLERFQKRHPEYDLRLDASDELADFARDDIDIAVRFGSGEYPGLVGHCLLPEVTIPVCSPTLLEGEHPLRTPADLRHHVLLHSHWRMSDDKMPNWRMWLRAAGLDDSDADRGPQFNLDTMVVQAAISGQGVALISSAYVADDIKEGRLIRPFPDTVNQATEFSHYVVYPETSRDDERVVAFTNWILDEASKDVSV